MTASVDSPAARNGHENHYEHINGGQRTNGNGHNGIIDETANGRSHSNGTAEAYEPMAIIGCGMRLPGGIETGEAMWDFLDNKREGRCRVPDDRYNIEAFYGPGRTGHVGSQYGHYLNYLDLAEVDTSFWSMTRQEIEEMDPQQRLALEVVYECFQSSGTTNWKGKKIGTYFGIFGEDWMTMQAKETQHTGVYRMPGSGDFVVANRVAYEFGLEGPSMVIRTACSSSLIGIHEACLDIQRGECESAIVGGTSLILNPHMTIAMTEQGVLSPDGRSKTFDASANGYARGEGVVAIHIKKLSDALRDNDPIRAVIRATCTNTDGRTAGMLQPSPTAHAALMVRSHELAGLDVSRTAMIECHGTGTPIGDPLETTAVARVFGKHGVFIGSLKPNLGHSEGASGVSSTIKAMLALERGLIPPNINFKEGNPKIPFEECRLTVPVETTPWPADKAQRIGINSFGIGGANAHILLESAAEMGVARPSEATPISDTHYLLTFSASHQDSLRQTVQRHEAYLRQHPDRLTDLSYTLNARREPLPHRAFAVVDASALDQDLQISTFERAGDLPAMAFVFTGQGAQWATMGAELLDTNVIFRESIAQMDQALRHCPDPPSWTISDELRKTGKESRLMAAEFSQPCCTAIQVALVDVLASWGVRPTGVVGHSSGEIAAAYASGALTRDAAIQIAYYRGVVAKDVKSRGAMAAIGLGRSAVESLLKPGVIVGCENSPSSVTLSGDFNAVEETMQTIREAHPDVLVRALRVDCAYHSHHMKTVEQQYLSKIGGLSVKKPLISFFSSVTGEVLQQAPDAAYWAANLTSPVLFSTAVSLLAKNMTAATVLLEVGPHSALAGPVRQILGAAGANKAVYASTLIRGEKAQHALLTAAGRLFQLGVELSWERIVSPGRTLTDLPLYAWHREGPFWCESRLSQHWRFRKFPKHDILGERVAAASDFGPTWRNVLWLDHVPWIRDHGVSGDIVFPAAGYMAMAGEAVRQLGDVDDYSYSLREVTISNALVLHEGQPTEIITHLRPVRLTNTLDSVWYEFEISALHGDRWLRHVVGQVRGGAEYERPTPAIAPRLRTVNAPHWYGVLRRFGLQYGPRFQGLRDITADVIERAAVATIAGPSAPEAGPHESEYTMHPTAIDHALQLYSVAASWGQGRRFTQLVVPSYVGAVYVQSAGGKDILLQAGADVTPRGAIFGDAVGTSGGTTVFRLENVRMSPLADATEARGVDPHAAVELVWKPDIRLIDNASLMYTARDLRKPGELPEVERLALACMVEGSLKLANWSEKEITNPANAFLAKYRAWFSAVREEALAGTYPNVPDCEEIAAMPSDARRALIEEIHSETATTGAGPLATAVYRVYHILESLFQGKADPLEVLLEDNLWARLYDIVRFVDTNNYFKVASHFKPNMRILEIGAGTGSITGAVLETLSSQPPHRERHYYSYTFTDISPGFFGRAKERFAAYEAVEYKVLDISQDPLEQGFEAESFDLILASNVIHATPSIATTLGNVRKLLSPTGFFFLQELAPPFKWVNFVMGAFSGWWLGESEGRINEPYLWPDQWKPYLEAAGFDGISAVHHDGQFNATMIVRPALPAVAPRITVLSHKTTRQAHVEDVVKALEKKGYGVDLRIWGQDIVPGQDVVCLVDIEKPYLQDMQLEGFSQLQDFIRGLNGAGVLWVMGLAQVKCTNPQYGQILGLTRNMRTELSIDFATIELETFDSAGWDAVATVLPEFQRRSITDSDTNPVMEWVFADGFIQISRFHWTSLNDELSVPDAGAGETNGVVARKLDIEKRGFLNSLYWKEYTPAKPEGKSLRMRNYASGLNFKDVLISMGIIDGRAIEGDGLGCEVAGIVEEVGPEVKGLEPGDRCVSIASGSFSTHLTTSEDLCVKIPDGMSFEEAATMPTVYLTVLYSLIDKARVEPGQTVLIHSAAGGVGIAAIQVCRYLGAEIYCTAGSEEKVNHLMKTYGIPRDRIFNSRDLTFRRDILQATGGKGVDVVLNSLSGELLHASWECVAEYGCMVEIGKRDLVGKGAIAMHLFEQNRSYIGVDFARICQNRPLIVSRLMKQVMDLYKSGDIKPITPMTCFESTKVEDAMRFMQKGAHMGKVVITLPKDPNELTTRAPKQQFHCHSDASYLLAGGLGGLGQAIAIWMAESGATEKLRTLGCNAILVAGDVTQMADIERAIASATKPIRGVMQATLVLKDMPFLNMTFDEWQGPTLPKIQGTWNLHSALLKHDLDFFLLFSSWSGVVGYQGQANYASANAFLDAFVQYRHAQGLPASAVDIGAVEDVGYVSRSAHLLDHFRVTSTYVLHEEDVLESLHVMINRSAPTLPQSTPGKKLLTPGDYSWISKGQIAIGLRSTQRLSAPNNRSVWKRDPRMALYKNMESNDGTTAAAGNEILQQFLGDVAQDPLLLDSEESHSLLANEIGKMLFGFLMRDVELLNLDDSLEALGVDSLVSIELRNWFRQRLGFEISALEILGSKSLLALGKHSAQMLKIKFAGGENATASGEQETKARYLVAKAP
ncbi:polyketide synthase [Trichoderma arundinaceum]|uniref:Polyketide synthase n=1 Tax=Trichoderma arundinaceum TaxID=490622 RepID=A0A395NUD1_TRIAR|nr:polyketide synthase [Trichoderma arundinaceum]